MINRIFMKKKLISLILVLIIIMLVITVGIACCSATDSQKVYLIGDTDLDNEITVKDATTTQLYIAHLMNITNEQKLVADVDHDNDITIKDATLTQLYIAHLSSNTDIGLPLEIKPDTKPETTESSVPDTESTTETEPETTETTDPVTEMTDIQIIVGEKTYTVKMYDNPSARELINRLPVTIEMNELNGNEKYYYFENEFPTNQEAVKNIKTGELMLYGSDCLVLFYKDFPTSYRYTRLGIIEDTSGLAEAVGNGNITITLKKQV